MTEDEMDFLRPLIAELGLKEPLTREQYVDFKQKLVDYGWTPPTPAAEVERKSREDRNRQVIVYDVVRIIDHPQYGGQVALIEGPCGEGAYELKLIEVGGSIAPIAKQRVKIIGSVAIPTIQVEKLVGPAHVAKINQIAASMRLGYDPHKNGLHVGVEISSDGVLVAVVGDEEGNEVRVRVSMPDPPISDAFIDVDLVDAVNRSFAAAMMKYETVAVARE